MFGFLKERRWVNQKLDNYLKTVWLNIFDNSFDSKTGLSFREMVEDFRFNICRVNQRRIKGETTTIQKSMRIRKTGFFFFNIECETVKAMNSYCNFQESIYVANFLKLLTSFGVRNIGVISPYKEQTLLIQKQWRKLNCEHYLDVEIKTIDGFQGKEKDLIIISCVKSYFNTKRGKLGSLIPS